MGGCLRRVDLNVATLRLKLIIPDMISYYDTKEQLRQGAETITPQVLNLYRLAFSCYFPPLL